MSMRCRIAFQRLNDVPPNRDRANRPAGAAAPAVPITTSATRPTGLWMRASDQGRQISTSTASQISPATRSIRTENIAFFQVPVSRAKNQMRAASPPTVEGKTWLKNEPINV